MKRATTHSSKRPVSGSDSSWGKVVDSLSVRWVGLRCRRFLACVLGLLGCSEQALAVNYYWLNTGGGNFGQSSNWTPFNPIWGLQGPGGASDTVHFDLGTSANNRYLVNNVNGVNDQLLVHNDSVAFEIDHYMLVSSGYASYGNTSMIVGFADGDVGDLLLTSDGVGILETNYVAIGDSSGSNGTVEVSSDLLQWVVVDDFYVGREGVGTLSVEAGSVFIDDALHVGDSEGSSGNVLVRGADSQFTVTTSMTIGDEGTGVLTVEDGASIHGSATLGFSRGSSGTINVRGEGTSWTSRAVGAAYEGTANITIEDGATAQTAGLWMGGWFDETFKTSTAVATVRGPGSSWTIWDDPESDHEGDLTVGVSSTAALHVEDGGAVSSVTSWIGLEHDAFGAVFVRGAGSSWTNEGDLFVGDEGWGTLNIIDGGQVSSADSWIGNQQDSHGTVNVRGPGTRWANGGEVFVGSHGDGILNIEEGGDVTSKGVWIGTSPGSTGVTTVRGAGSTWTSKGQFIVGYRSSGTLLIESGGVVATDAGDTTIAYAPSVGDGSLATVRGKGSAWINGGSLRVGLSGAGTLSIEDGGRVTSGDGLIGSTTGSSGEVLVTGSNSNWKITGRLDIGGSPTVGDGGDGLLHIAQGAAVSVADEIALYANGTLRLDGGTLSAQAIDLQTGAEFDWTDGRLAVAAFDGSLVNQAGALAPDGHMSVLGQYTQMSAGRLEIDITSASLKSGYDMLDVAGNALLDGDLNVALLSAIVPKPDDVFTILNAKGILGSFANAADGERLTTVDGSGSFLVNYQTTKGLVLLSDYLPASGAAALAAVPEPSAALLMVGISTLALVRRSRSDRRGRSHANPRRRLPRAWQRTLCAIATAVMLGWQTQAQAIDYVRTLAGGEFQNASAWSPFQIQPTPQFGPGGADDTVDFNQGVVAPARYTISDVNGENDQLFVHNDSLTLDISDYSLPWNNSGFPGMIVGEVAGDLGDLILTGADDDATLEMGGIIVGKAAGAIGNVTFNDSDLQASIGSVVVGQQGAGSLTFENGANVASHRVRVGYNVGSTGTLAVRDPGTDLTDTGDFFTIGLYSNGMMIVEDGGAVTSNYGTLAYDPDAIGTVVVRGAGSTWTNEGELLVGDGGTGTLTAKQGGRLITTKTWLGTDPGSSGTVDIRDSGSTWSSSDQIFVGYRGTGSLLIEDGGSVISPSGAIAFGPGSLGTASISGSQSSWEVQGPLEIGGTTTFGNGGAGTLEIESGGTVSIAEQLVLFPEGSVQLSGGMLAANEILFQWGGQFDWTAGRLQVDTYDGDLVNQSGILAPSGTTNILGSYTQQSNAALEIDFEHEPLGFGFDFAFDSLSIENDFNLGLGQLEVSLASDVHLPVGQQFEIVTVGGELTGQFAGLEEGGLVGNFGGRDLFITYAAGDGNDIALFTTNDLPGDFDADGDVDGSDFILWQHNPSIGNLADWQASFGAPHSANIFTAPEPSTAVLLALGVICLPRRCRG